MVFGLVSWKHLFFLQGRNLLVDDQNNEKGGDIKKTKRKDQISRVFFFFFVNQNLCQIFFMLFLSLQILHLKRDADDKVNNCLVVSNTL